MFRGTPQRTGAAREQAEPTLTPLWQFQTQTNIVSSPVVYKGSVYFGTRDNSIWSLNARTGAQEWNFSTGGWVDATPCVSSDTVYCPSRDQNLYAINRLTGELKWKTPTGSTDVSSPLLDGNKLYFVSGSPASALYEINALNGNIIRSYPLGSFGFSSPAISNGVLYFGTNDGTLHALDISSGAMKWELSTKSNIGFGCMVVNAAAVYAIAGGDEQTLFAINPQTGAILWQSVQLDTETAVVSSIAATDDAVYAICSKTLTIDGNPPVSDCRLILYSFPLTGATPQSARWSADVGAANQIGIVASPCIAGDIIYTASGDGTLYALQASNGNYISPWTGLPQSVSTGTYLSYSGIDTSTGIVASPTVSNGVVYVNTYDGSVWALQAGNAAALSSPDNADTVTNQTFIYGTALNRTLTGYTIDYAPGTNPAPSQWATITTATSPVNNAALGAWNTRSLADGTYTIRLTVNNNSLAPAANTFVIDNSPKEPEHIKAADTPLDGGGSLTITWGLSADDGAGNNDVRSYQLYKSTWSGGFAPLVKLNAGVTTYIDTNCPVYTTYYYIVTALDNSSESGSLGTASAFSIADGVMIDPNLGYNVPLTINGLTTYLVIEPHTFSNTVYAGISVPESVTATGVGRSHATAIEREFSVSPANTKFLKPVTIKVPYTPSDAAGINRENLRLYWWDAASNEWRVINTSDPSSEDGSVWAVIPNFYTNGRLTCRIMGYVPGSEELLQEDKVYTYPNPAKGEKLSFKYYLGSKADIKIDVYNVAGQPIAHLEKDNNPAGIASELEWNMNDIASGVYIWRIEARSDSETKAIKKKLAIIH